MTSVALCARAQALRLRADAIAETQSPVGLVTLEGQDKLKPWIDAETMFWAGAGGAAAFDVMALSVRVRAPRGLADVRVGRFVVATGAVMPVQIDGADAVARAPWGTSIETFGGAPVVPRFGDRDYDWIVGGRVAQSVASRASLGLSYVQRREDGEVADHEAGLDFAAAPVRFLDVAARGSYDLSTLGVSEALASVAARTKSLRFETFASTRSPSRILPATSLFSVLGDFPSQMLGETVRWKAAPRLDVLATGAAQIVGGEYGGNASLSATLKLDDRGAGALGLELRRVDVSSSRWTGVRATATEPIAYGVRFSTEVEVAVPDHDDGRGFVWPWGLMALGWKRSGWEIAGAVEASSTPEVRYATNALLRVARVLEVP